MLTRYPRFLRALAFPLLVLVIDLALVEALSQVAALLTTQLFGANGPAFEDVAYYSKVLFVIPVLLLGARLFEKRSFAEVGFAPRHVWQNILLGLTISATVMSLTALILALAGWYHVQSVPADINNIVATLLSGLLLYCVIAIQEEVIFRGILFRLLERGLGSWVALGISALTFGWFHIANPGASWISSLAIALEAGITLAAAYMLTRNLWLCIGLHWGWNFFEGTVFGFSVSGTSSPVLVQSYTTGPSLWTGGQFGPEAGLVTVTLSIVLFSVLLYLAAKRGRICAPAFLAYIPVGHAKKECNA
ncbi:MAG TPA: type II CAAX endopeptidase family protein [Ktedonobacteraceae bacterium]|nr:type II CAAX endopeptidase family protein [Ktedonobacteraceae bacterium]